MSRERMAAGIAPREAVAFVEEVRALHGQLERTTGSLCRAYDAELARIYDYTFCGPPAAAPEELTRARAAWWEAVAAFRDQLEKLHVPGEEQP